MWDKLDELCEELFGGKMHDLTPEESALIQKNIEKRSKVIPGNYFEELKETKSEERMSKIIQLGNLRKDSLKFKNPQTGRVYSAEGYSPTINTCQGESDNQRC